MDVIHSVAALRERLQREPNNVFVPTMGNLHAGHIQLINIAKPRAGVNVVAHPSAIPSVHCLVQKNVIQRGLVVDVQESIF